MTYYIIEHADGRRYSVTEEAFHRVYEPEGFALGEPETTADFVADVPAPKRARRAPKAKRAKPLPTTDPEPAAE